MASFWKTATSNAFNTTLNGNVAIGDNTITLTSVTGLQAPGVLVLDRVDANGVATNTLREYISYTGISTNTLTGVARGLGGSSAQGHASGAKVEEVFSITHWNDLLTLLLNVFTSGGLLDTTKVVDLTTAQTLTSKIFTSPTLNTPTVNTPTVKSAIQTVTAMAAQAVDGTVGNVFTRTLAASETFTQSGFTTGQCFMVEVTQGSGTTYTVTWFAGVTWRTAGGTAPTQTTTSSGKTTYGFRCTGSNTFDGYLVGAN